MSACPDWEIDSFTEQLTTEHLVSDHVDQLLDVIADLAEQHEFLVRWGDGVGGYLLYRLAQKLSDRGVEPKTSASVPSMISRLIQRDGAFCWYCGSPVGGPHFPRAEADHVIPKSKGGLNSIDNRVIACSPCNQRKRARDPREFLAEIAPEVEAADEEIVLPRRPGWRRK